MKRLLVFIVSVLAMGSAGAQVLPTRDVGWVFAESELQRFPEAWQLDHGTRLFFGYSQGVGCKAMLGLWKASGDDRFLRYVEQWTDTLIGDDGSILRYEPEAYNLDFINSGKVLFDIYRVTGNEKYRRAMDRLIRQLTNQPRTCDGGYWHKLIYPHQMWLDGIYMASPFMAQYGRTFDQPQWVDEAVRQITLCHTHTYDAATGPTTTATTRADSSVGPTTGRAAHRHSGDAASAGGSWRSWTPWNSYPPTTRATNVYTATSPTSPWC